jgi:CRP/FNR family cyclic AMP-dependent transcriptional regulator
MYSQLQPLIKRSLVRKYAASSTILYQGEAPRSACILAKGIVRVFSISSQGDEQIVSFHVAGEFFPTSWIFRKAPGTLFFYEALTDCEVAMCDRDELIQYMRATPERTDTLLDYYTTNFAASMIRVNALEQPKAHDKLVYTLFYLCQRYSKELGGIIEIPLTLTHQNFASLVGLTRETVAIEMNKLKKSGVIDYKQRRYFVHRDKLFALLGEDSFKGLSIKEPR